MAYDETANGEEKSSSPFINYITHYSNVDVIIVVLCVS